MEDLRNEHEVERGQLTAEISTLRAGQTALEAVRADLEQRIAVLNDKNDDTGRYWRRGKVFLCMCILGA